MNSLQEIPLWFFALYLRCDFYHPPHPRSVNRTIFSISAVLVLISPLASAATSIDAVYFAQTHVQKATDPYFVIVGNREALVKAHIVDPATPSAPAVTAVLSLNGDTLNLPLTGPAVLPASIPDGPGVIQHTNANSFTAIIPAAWVKPGLSVTIQAGVAQANFPSLSIGAPTKVIMTMTDVHFFSLAPGDYPAGWNNEIEAKWPVSSLDVRRANDVVFPELVMPPRSPAPAARVISKQDYTNQTGLSWDGENTAATAWNVALRRAAGRTVGYSLYYLNKYNVANEGVAGGFSGVGTGNAGSLGILHHELGHALSLPHWGDSAAYPYKGVMHGIQPPAVYNLTHAGPTWAFHLPTRAYIPCTIQPNNPDGRPAGTYKVDPMQGGGVGSQEPGYLMNHFSDYSVHQMRNYLQNTVVVWNETLGSYAKWNATTQDYTTLLTNNGVQYPLLRDQSVISIIAAVSGASPDVCMVYPPVGPYTTGLIRLFDPTNAADRAAAAATFSPAGGSDACLRVTQGGSVKTYMLAASYDTSADPLNAASLFTEGINLPAADGAVTRVELLLTPDAQINGLPVNPEVLYTWTAAATPPSPNPATFAVAPTADGPYAISMTSTIGTADSDSNGRIEYLFTETTGKPGGSSSTWQSSPTYTDLGLQPNTEYRYTVTMRSGVSKSQTTPSPPFAVTTGVGTATLTRLIAGDAANTNGWLNGTWQPAIPSSIIDAEIAPAVQFRTSSVLPVWSGTLLFDTGSSMDIRNGGESVLQGPTSITFRDAGIYDYSASDLVIPPLILDGGGFFQCNNTGAQNRSRTFNGSISGSGGFSTSPQRLMTYSFNQTNPFSGGYTLKAGSRHVVEFNAAGAAGLGNVTVLEAGGANAPLSAVIRLGANNVFHPSATLTLNGKGWNNLTGGVYPSRLTRIDMKTFHATVARLIIDGVEMAAGTYTGTAGTQDWIDGTGTLTVTGMTPYLEWISDYPTVGFATGTADSSDGDALNNLLEYAFGTDPTTSDSGALAYEANGAVTAPGSPITQNLGSGGGVDYRAIFTRRKNHYVAGITYTVHFSADLIHWTAGTDSPSLLTGSTNPAEVEAVSVPFPDLVPATGGNKKPTFFRVAIAMP